MLISLLTIKVWAYRRLYDVRTESFDASVSHFQTNFGPGLYEITNVENGPIDIGTRQEADVPVVSANQAAVVSSIESL